MKQNNFPTRRLIFGLLGSWIVSSASRDAAALDLMSDDRSFIRTFELPAQKLLLLFPQGVRFGAPDPDIILLEFSDYNCGYCRRAWPPLADGLSSDPRLAVHLVHLAILSPGSEAAAAFHHAIYLRDGSDRADLLHRTLMTLSGPVDGDRAARICDRLAIELPSTAALEAARLTVQETRRLAKTLGIRYTPTFALANTAFIGWPGPKTLSHMIAQARRCGQVQCG